MCETCGCNVTPANEFTPVKKDSTVIDVMRGLLSDNDHQAAHNRTHFDSHSVLAINLMSSPGSGKTALLEKTIDALAGEFRIAVIEGDLETENDAQRIRAHGVPAIQISTGTACHLDAHMLHNALHNLELAELDIVFIENVGNLVCPASFDLGHHRNITLLSVTEGDDKPAKYPVIFRGANLVLLSKADLLPILGDFEPQAAEQHLRQLANTAPVLQVSAKTGAGLDAWLDWLREQVEEYRRQLGKGQTLRPAIQKDGVALHRKAEHHHVHHEHR